MENIQPHFYVVRKKQKLRDIINTLYDSDAFVSNWSVIRRFLHLNDIVAEDGKVESGQWLYVPRLHPIYSDSEIKQTLAEINIIYQKFSKGMKQTMAYGHRLLTFAEAQTPFGIGIWMSTYKYRVREIRNILQEFEEEFLAIGRKFGTITPKVAPEFYEFRRVKFHQLDLAMGKLMRVIMAPNVAKDESLRHQMAINMKSELLDLKRVGASKLHLSSFPKMFKRLARLSKTFELLGWLAVVIDVGKGANRTYDVCSLHPDSDVCYRTGAGEAGRVGGGTALGSFSFAATYGVCNAATDIETLGGGIIGCAVVAGVVSAVSGNVGGYFGKRFGNFIFNKTYGIYEHSY